MTDIDWRPLVSRFARRRAPAPSVPERVVTDAAAPGKPPFEDPQAGCGGWTAADTEPFATFLIVLREGAAPS